MHTIPRDRLRDGEIHVTRRNDMVTVSSVGGMRTTIIGMSRHEAKQVGRALIQEGEERTAEEREGLRHALMHLDLPKEVDDGIVDYD